MDEGNKSGNVITMGKPSLRDEELHSKVIQYKPNEELLQSTSRIKKQRDIIQDRVDKMEAGKDRVTKSVYEKVRRDYLLQLQTVQELLDEKKSLLKNEIKELYRRREKITAEINRHKEILEEARFRHYLDEFTQSQYQEVENFETKEIEKLEADLAHLNEFIRSHETLFDPQDFGGSTRPSKPASTAFKTPPLSEPETFEEVTPAKAKIAAPKPEKKETPKPAPKPQEETDFEDLFLEEEEDEEQKIREQESISNIKKIIEESDQNGDYFAKERVSESSFTVKKQGFDTDSLLPSKRADQSAVKTEVSIKNRETGTRETVTKKSPADDSISEILESISLEDSLSLDKPTPAVSPTAKADGEAGHVLTLTEGEHETREFSLKDNISIGRSPTNDIVLKAPKVSRQHAAINKYNNQFIIIDLKSSNGVYVNGQKVDECVLNSGDEISIGGYKFVLSKR